MLRRIGWIVMTLSALVLALVSARYLLPSMPGAFPQQAALYLDIRPWVVFHVAGGIVAILAGPWQFWTSFRARHLKWHRRIGKTYIAGALIGAAGGVYLAQHSYGGLVTHVGFSLMAVVWATTTLTALGHIRRNNVEVHREWMVRSYAVALGFVSLRIWIPLLSAFGFPFDEVYQTVSWLCWVPNLLVAEMYLGWRRQRRAGAV